jgi:hypothetical protein
MNDATGEKICGLGLRDAKDAIDAMIAEVERRGGTLAGFRRIEWIKNLREATLEAAEREQVAKQVRNLENDRAKMLRQWLDRSNDMLNIATELVSLHADIQTNRRMIKEIDPDAYVGDFSTGATALEAAFGYRAAEFGIGFNPAASPAPAQNVAEDAGPNGWLSTGEGGGYDADFGDVPELSETAQPAPTLGELGGEIDSIGTMLTNFMALMGYVVGPENTIKYNPSKANALYPADASDIYPIDETPF